MIMKNEKIAGLLSAEENAAKYQLCSEIRSVEQPMFGFDMTVTAGVKYALATKK